MRPYCVKSLDNTAVFSAGLSLSGHISDRQNCFAPASDGFSSDFWFLSLGGLTPAKAKRAKRAGKTRWQACLPLSTDGRNAENARNYNLDVVGMTDYIENKCGWRRNVIYYDAEIINQINILRKRY